MQQFAVIASPNGAGKSSFSALLSPVNAFVFDPDLQRAKISHNYPDIAVETALTSEYQLQEELVLNKNISPSPCIYKINT